MNSIKYGQMHEILQTEEGAVRSHWVGAAADVTSLDALGALDSPAGALVDDAAADVLRTVHHKLAPANFTLFERMRAGQLPEDLHGLSGKALDHALVEREQALVQQHYEAAVAKLPEAERAAVAAELSRLIDPRGIRKIAADTLSDRAVLNAFDKAFPTGGFDFANRSHREALGKAMIDLRYEAAR